ncbi:NAD(P)/FAD-dependent oxidoreductase [Halostagnicola kamekurae]|uniref:Glycine/D-amino acid oxidase n=1 Tax=Halostagnicola kamekurae TaxID=619731 RepID=A0A1I6RWZ0_9EURY|nr:FAD-binding oxidoreductase [Halostagnicola kamekurae]SFS68988.1 Glycine/D-amino acid oxidase [Halostagnicola kamekurae]
MPEPDLETDLAVGSDAFADAGAGLEVAVVGAGAIGATTAYDLARRGASVTLYDSGSVASGASGRAAGLCYDAFASALDAEIAGEAIERFRAFSGDDTFPFVECPYVWFAREGDEERAAAIREQVDRMQRNGVVALEMTGSELGERFPALRGDDVAVAAVAGAAGYTDPAQYTACLAAAADGAGADLEPETPVAVSVDQPRVEPVDDAGGVAGERDVDAVVVTAGAHTKRLLAEAGVSIALKPYRVQALIADAELDEPMWYDATDGLYARPHPEGILVGNGTEPVEADPDAYDRAASDAFLEGIPGRVDERLEGISLEIDRAWAGLCTATPDRDPLVGEVRPGLFVATGFQGEGVMRAPAIGDRLAAMVLDDDGGLDRFDPTRFAGDESFDIVEGMGVDSEG